MFRLHAPFLTAHQHVSIGKNDPTTPRLQPLTGITQPRFSLIRFRSPLLTESLLFSLPVGTEMFHFPTFPPHTLYIQVRVTGLASSRVSPFGNPRITVWLSTPRGLSQIPTSFIGSWCQGIHRTLLKTYTKKLHRALQMLRVHYAILKQHTAPPPPTPTQTHKPRSFSAAGARPANPEKTNPNHHHNPPRSCTSRRRSFLQDPTTCRHPTPSNHPEHLSTTPSPASVITHISRTTGSYLVETATRSRAP